MARIAPRPDAPLVSHSPISLTLLMVRRRVRQRVTHRHGLRPLLGSGLPHILPLQNTISSGGAHRRHKRLSTIRAGVRRQRIHRLPASMPFLGPRLPRGQRLAHRILPTARIPRRRCDASGAARSIPPVPSAALSAMPCCHVPVHRTPPQRPCRVPRLAHPCIPLGRQTDAWIRASCGRPSSAARPVVEARAPRWALAPR